MIFTVKSFLLQDLVFLREKIAKVGQDFKNIRFALANETDNRDLLTVSIFVQIIFKFNLIQVKSI